MCVGGYVIDTPEAISASQKLKSSFIALSDDVNNPMVVDDDELEHDHPEVDIAEVHEAVKEEIELMRRRASIAGLIPDLDVLKSSNEYALPPSLHPGMRQVSMIDEDEVRKTVQDELDMMRKRGNSVTLWNFDVESAHNSNHTKSRSSSISGSAVEKSPLH